MYAARADTHGRLRFNTARRARRCRVVATLLLLTAGTQLQLDALPGDDFNAAALQSLRGFPGQQPGEGNGKVLYVPR